MSLISLCIIDEFYSEFKINEIKILYSRHNYILGIILCFENCRSWSIKMVRF